VGTRFVPVPKRSQRACPPRTRRSAAGRLRGDERCGGERLCRPRLRHRFPEPPRLAVDAGQIAAGHRLERAPPFARRLPVVSAPRVCARGRRRRSSCGTQRVQGWPPTLVPRTEACPSRGRGAPSRPRVVQGAAPSRVA
ncbi:unnamed protein product, partial [Ixodes pacificus]